VDFPNFQTLFQIARNEALARNSSMTRDAIEREGSDANIMIAAAVAAADQVVGQQVVNIAGQFLDSALGDALDKLLFDRYGLTRKVAAASVGTVMFTTTVAAPTAFLVPVCGWFYRAGLCGGSEPVGGGGSAGADRNDYQHYQPDSWCSY